MFVSGHGPGQPPPHPPLHRPPPWPDRDSAGAAEKHFAVAATLFSRLETLFVCCWLRWCLLSPRWDHPSLSLPCLPSQPSVPLAPSSSLQWLGPPHRGVEFNKGSLSHMLKRYANVQVLLFSDVFPPLHPTDCSSLQAKAKQREGVCERERVWVFVFQRNGLFC